MASEPTADLLLPESQADTLPQQQEPYTPPHLEPQEQYLLVTGLSI